jgi:hypothetical protein
MMYKVLDLSSNRFSGTLPNLNFLWPTITDLSSNELSQVNFPIGALTLFTTFVALGKNNFFGNLSKIFTNMNGPVHLDTHDNNIIGELPKSICQISTLRVLILRNNSL